MENNQTVQELDKGKTPTSQVENGTSKPITIGDVLIYLLGNYPWLFVIALLGVFIGVGTLSFYSLSSVGVVEQTKLEEQEPLVAEVVEPTNTQPDNSNPISLWVVVAIALSCASGCLIILRFLNRPTSSRKAHKQTNRYPVKISPHPQTLESLPPENAQVPLPLQPQAPVTATLTKTKPLVRVLPPQPKHQKGKQSLANILDIRKENPLSDILQKK
ncbi:hypothetical protein G7B40_005860 [Aetokthonos hydrillicola Thurmond2011]|jgi:hypothetical protein|uniref:Uncharacterized protein n=1 Tax=Aetokthonos hydrillicola Thurmond2011 TaxID=2712845 RepID=A0AAP5M3S1_9CYAN|nr:hypothetical protein [Aetokthonos hydrillicola]MBO3463530.1 hypothetical protein [Aetokthonos hydrillicola CCALA 1050]MBW4588855.1 hypothetical protein [Aetokthonos hydrillicola CCALA 1050]MDR9894096.1 hypothetical protein [Aetokthonos hydrillicola Thurmond2011]